MCSFREEGEERNTDGREAPMDCPAHSQTWDPRRGHGSHAWTGDAPTTEACALTRNQTAAFQL